MKTLAKDKGHDPEKSQNLDKNMKSSFQRKDNCKIVKIKAVKGDIHSINSVKVTPKKTKNPTNSNKESKYSTPGSDFKQKTNSAKKSIFKNLQFNSERSKISSNRSKQPSYDPYERLDAEVSEMEYRPLEREKTNEDGNYLVPGVQDFQGISDHISNFQQSDFRFDYPGFSSYASSSFVDINNTKKNPGGVKSTNHKGSSLISSNDGMKEVKWRLQLEEMRKEKERELTISKFINKGEEDLSSSSFVSDRYEDGKEAVDSQTQNNYAKNLHRYRIKIPRVQLYPAVKMLKSKRGPNYLDLSEKSERSGFCRTVSTINTRKKHRRVVSCVQNSKKILERQISLTKETDKSLLFTEKSEIGGLYQGYCQICFSDNVKLECIQSSCGHKFCRNCLLFYLKHRINHRLTYSIPCPMANCKYNIRSYFVRDFLLKYDFDNEVLFKYDIGSDWKKKLLSLVYGNKRVKGRKKIMSSNRVKVSYSS